MIEVVITSAIAVMITGFLITNFSRSRNELAAAAPSVVGDIRRAQSLTISGSQAEGVHRCGFGVVFEQNEYVIYAGPVADGTCSSTDDFQFGGVGDFVVERVVLGDSLEFKTTGDVYFVPPLPYTYLDGSRDVDTPPLIITLGTLGKTCSPTTCRYVRVDREGQITSVTQSDE